MFLHDSWPWCKGQSAMLTVSEDGVAKVSCQTAELHIKAMFQI